MMAKSSFKVSSFDCVEVGSVLQTKFNLLRSEYNSFLPDASGSSPMQIIVSSLLVCET